MIVVFVCNKYSPAHIYSIESYAEIFDSKGIDTFLLTDFLTNGQKFDLTKTKLANLDQLNLLNCKEVVFFFVSPNVNNIKTIKTINKKMPESKSVYLYHEPINRQVCKEIFKDRGFSFKTLKYVFGLKLFNGKRLVRKFDHIILPSLNSNSIYESCRFFKKTSHSIIHLLFSKKENKCIEERVFISYIGTIANNHGFFEFINYLMSDKTLPNASFLIATSSALDDRIRSSLINKFGEKIVIYSGSFMSDDFISKLYNQTKVLWLGYKHSAQSGVLPMAFMNGTPIICSEIPAFNEFVQNGINCELINIDDYDSINRGIDKITKNFNSYHKGCIDSYFSFFNPKANEDKVLSTFKNLFLNNK